MATCDDVRLVVVGHVDHGKSTLIGRLLHDAGSLPDGKMDALVEAARRRGTPFEWANLTDSLQAERDQNVTIDTAQIWFRDGDRRYVIIDAPGHREFLKNMVTGAAQADAALVIVDAHSGVGDESRRHGSLIALLGIRQVMVLVNKMDLVGYSAARFAEVAAEYTAFLASVGLTPMAVMPVSAREGDLLVHRSPRLPWFDGPPLMQVLGRLTPRVQPAAGAFRLPVQDVYRFDHRRVVAGRVESGSVRVGDSVVCLPSGERSTIKSIERWRGSLTEPGRAGESIGVTLSDQLFVERGSVLANPAMPPTVTTSFRAKVFWLGRAPLTTTRTYRVKLATQDMECQIERIGAVVDSASLDQVTRDAPSIDRNEVGEVTIRTRRPLVVDSHATVAALGRFVLVDGLDIAGGGIILDTGAPATARDAEALPLVRSAALVTLAERAQRNRHRGAVVWLTGLSGSGKSTLANALERALFDLGRQVFVLDGDNVRLGLNSDLGFSAADRAQNIRRVAEVAKLFAEAGLVVVTAFISPYRSDRVGARRILSEGGDAIPFLEVYLDAPMAVCEQRDPKGLYAKARDGRIRQFTGISDPYEPPDQPEVIVHSGHDSVSDCVALLMASLDKSITLR